MATPHSGLPLLGAGLGCLLFCASIAVARADSLPITVDAAAIGGTPKVKTQTKGAASMTMAEWRRDQEGRSLVVVLVKPAPPVDNNTLLQKLYDTRFKEGLTTDKDEADVREEGRGSTSLWNGTVEWMMGSERAEQNPMFSLDNTSNKASRGDARLYCVQFVWKGDRPETMSGSYCQLPPSKPDAESMLRPLSITFQ